MKDPLDAIEHPTLAEQVEPYRKYGDGELAISLLHFQKREAVGVPPLKQSGTDAATFAVQSQPANVGFSYHCPSCKENVRQVTRSPESVGKCPMCGKHPGMLALGEGPK